MKNANVLPVGSWMNRLRTEHWIDALNLSTDATVKYDFSECIQTGTDGVEYVSTKNVSEQVPSWMMREIECEVEQIMVLKENKTRVLN